MSKWPRLRLTKYVDDLTISYRGMNHTVATVITEALSSMVGWLENGLDFHVSKDEEGVEGKSVVLVSNASLKAALTSSAKALGMRVVSHARILGVDAYGAGAVRQRRTQYARLTKIKKRMPKVKFYKKYGAITSKIAKAELMPSGPHGVRCMGLPPMRRQANMRDVLSPAGWRRTSATRRTHAESSPSCHGRRQCGTFARGLETTATIGGLEAVVEQARSVVRRVHHHVFEAAGMDMASPRDLRHC